MYISDLFLYYFFVYKTLKKISINIEAISDYRAWVDNAEYILLNIFG